MFWWCCWFKKSTVHVRDRNGYLWIQPFIFICVHTLQPCQTNLPTNVVQVQEFHITTPNAKNVSPNIKGNKAYEMYENFGDTTWFSCKLGKSHQCKIIPIWTTQVLMTSKDVAVWACMVSLILSVAIYNKLFLIQNT